MTEMIASALSFLCLRAKSFFDGVSCFLRTSPKFIPAACAS